MLLNTITVHGLCPSHLSLLIKCVAISGSIYNLSSFDTFHHHSAIVTAPSFDAPPSLPFPRNLLSADADGSFSLSDANVFIHLKTLPSIRRRAINNLALHPSGTLALSVHRDEFLIVVNLVRGRRSFYCHLSKGASVMRFNSAVGDRFFMAMEDKVAMHEAEDSRLLLELDCQGGGKKKEWSYGRI